jgi:hypothetical protein
MNCPYNILLALKGVILYGCPGFPVVRILKRSCANLIALMFVKSLKILDSRQKRPEYNMLYAVPAGVNLRRAEKVRGTEQVYYVCATHYVV